MMLRLFGERVLKIPALSSYEYDHCKIIEVIHSSPKHMNTSGNDKSTSSELNMLLAQPGIILTDRLAITKGKVVYILKATPCQKILAKY